MAKSSTTSPGAFHRLVIPSLVVFYLLAVMFLCAIAIVRLWPESNFIKAANEVRLRRDAELEVTDNMKVLIERGASLLRRWENSGQDSLTRLDRSSLATALTSARDSSGVLLKEPASIAGILKRLEAGDIQSITGKDRLEASDWLVGTIDLLDQRRQMLLQIGTPVFGQLSFGRLDNAAVFPPLGFKEIQDRLQREEVKAAAKSYTYFGSADLDLLVLLTTFGALGATVQGLSSVSKYLGTDRFVSRWTVYYLARPFVGLALAAAFYLVLRAGIFTPETPLNQTTDGTNQTNIYGAVAIALLVGLFSAQAMEKLRIVADSFFSSSSSKDSLDGRNPHITSVNIGLDEAKPEWTVDIVGQRFSRDSYIILGSEVYGASEGVTFLDEGHLLLKITKAPAFSPSKISIVRPGSDGGVSNVVRVKWVEAPPADLPG